MVLNVMCYIFLRHGVLSALYYAIARPSVDQSKTVEVRI